MKVSIYELLGLIKDGKAPKTINYDNKMWVFYEEEKDYVCGYLWLFDEYIIISILDDEVEILETTITYKPDNIENNKQDKIEKIDIDGYILSIDGTKKIDDFTINEKILINKINEIIDRWNNDNR